MLTPSRSHRLAEFFRRILAAPIAATHDEAYAQLVDTLNSVENELTDVPYDPANWKNDRRLYPPLQDSAFAVPDHPELVEYRSRGHKTIIGANGAIEIQTLDGTAVLSKPGADGRTVWD